MTQVEPGNEASMRVYTHDSAFRYDVLAYMFVYMYM